MTFVVFFPQALNAIPDQDQFYDVTDHLEEQGMERIIQHHMNKKGADLDLLEQFQIYEAVLKQEDCATDAPLLQQIENLRLEEVILDLKESYICSWVM